jgi:large subunit ribosomal protein L15
MKLNTLNPGKGATHSQKRVGRGQGSGTGGTSTRGHKGAGSRSGYSHKRGFEGGQMPLYRRIPKFGFKNPFRVEYDVINLDTLQKMVDANPSLSEVNHDYLVSVGLISTNRQLVKVLGRGELKGKLSVKLNKFSNTAKAAIEKAGGTATEI